ncbi:unnamed protein product [Brassicogethes aeneus]|uniref:Phorbol-ester/DAG-type domain-containing protein n=1 Tax=Brassicogethes aeneus TaxID=1431903 RepID=A0A9P0B205_BRAAE|nr:unnamed protein product [Brassicogethes aeneus]
MSNDFVNEQNKCKRCKTSALSGPKCIKCGVVSHSSCLKLLKNIKFIDEKNVQCCDDDLDSTSDSESNDTVLGNDASSLENYYLKELLKQKDVHILSLEDKILILKKQINLLKQLTPPGEKTNQNKNPAQSKSLVPQNSKTTDTKPNSKTNQTKAKNSNTNIQNPIITKSEMTAAINIALKPDVIDKKDDINKENNTPTNNHKNNKQTNAFIKGTNNSNTLKVVEKNAWIYVTNLHEETTEKQIEDYLATICKTQCEKLTQNFENSKKSSFKICAPYKFKNQILDGNIWPEGTLINRSEVLCIKQKDKVISYFCEDCKFEITQNSQLLTIILELQKEIKGLNSKVSELENKFINVNAQKSVPDDCKFIENVILESQEREKRSKNVLLFNINEEDEDFEKIAKNVITGISNLVNTDNLKIYRIGKKTDGKKRPVKIEFKSAVDAKTILVNKTKVNEPYRNIKINNDLTFLQRKYLENLRSELENKNKSDSNVKYTIKYKNGLPTIVKLD